MKKHTTTTDFDDLNVVLDKMLQLQKSKSQISAIKIIICIATSIAVLIITVTLCVMLAKNDFSLESLISLLLAFFSIFISIFFYFKTDETSNRFYDSSYEFMKDVSVTLGKIEERFGEKLNNINDKISHLSNQKQAKVEEIQTAEDEQQKIIDELLDKAKLDEQTKRTYRDKLQDSEKELQNLRRQLSNLEHQYNMVTKNQTSNLVFPSKPMMISLRNGNYRNLAPFHKKKLKECGLIDDFEELTPDAKELIKEYFD